MPNQQIIGAEELGYWYLRLNGCFTIPNFVVHPDSGSQQKTDIDVLGVRFPFRNQRPELPHMKDDKFFARYGNETLLLLAEIKKGRCSINSSWCDEKKNAIAGAIVATGVFPEERVELVVTSLRDTGSYSSPPYETRLVALGGERDEDLAKQLPDLPQILWPEILRFVHRRFIDSAPQKRSHHQWDKTAKALWDVTQRVSDPDEFVMCIRIENHTIA